LGCREGRFEYPEAPRRFGEAVTVFADPLAVIAADSVHEDRALIIGESGLERLIVTLFAEIHEDTIRIISARRATKQERKRYEI